MPHRVSRSGRSDSAKFRVVDGRVSGARCATARSLRRGLAAEQSQQREAQEAQEAAPPGRYSAQRRCPVTSGGRPSETPLELLGARLLHPWGAQGRTPDTDASGTGSKEEGLLVLGERFAQDRSEVCKVAQQLLLKSDIIMHWDIRARIRTNIGPACTPKPPRSRTCVISKHSFIFRSREDLIVSEDDGLEEAAEDALPKAPAEDLLLGVSGDKHARLCPWGSIGCRAAGVSLIQGEVDFLGEAPSMDSSCRVVSSRLASSCFGVGSLCMRLRFAGQLGSPLRHVQKADPLVRTSPLSLALSCSHWRRKSTTWKLRMEFQHIRGPQHAACLLRPCSAMTP